MKTKRHFWDVPKKYNTLCMNSATGKILESKTIEAVTSDEAKSRAHLLCMLSHGHDTLVKIDGLSQ
jgi:hypothetical protein